MSMLAPWFLLGLLALALPVWLHRLQTQSSERRAFSSTMLLERSEQRVHVRRRLKYFVLLTMRLLLLAALALAFAKPFLERPPAVAADAAAGTHFVVVDVSASMGRSGVFAQALEQARAAIAAAPAGARIEVLAAADRLRPVDDRGGNPPERALARLAPGPLRLDFGTLARDLETMAAAAAAPVTVHLISDFQATAMPVRFADAVPAGVATLEPRPVGSGEPVNWSVDTLGETPTGFEVGVRAHGAAERTADVRLMLNGETVGVRSVTGPGRVTLEFDGVTLAEGDNRVEVRLDADDDLEADNRYFAVVVNDPPLPVPIITRSPEGLAMTYLGAALGAADDEGYVALPLVIGDFDARVLTRYRWAIVTDLAAVDAALASGLRDFLDAGGNLLAFVASDPAGRDTLPLTDHRRRPADLDQAGRGLYTLGRIDLRHPVTAAADGWSRVTVSRRFGIEPSPEDRVLIRLADDSPLLVERPVGDGRLLLLTSGADNRWNDLPVHPVFVGLVLEAARYLDGRDALATSYTAGAALPLGTAGGASGQVIDPDGEALLALADTARTQVVRLEKPGIYEVYTGKGDSLIAANVDGRESVLDPIADATLERWREATRTDVVGADRRQAAPESRPLELWPWLLLLLALLVIAESALGNHHLATRAGAS